MLESEEIKCDGTDITRDVWSSLASMWESELARAEIEQTKLMQAEQRVTGGERKDLPFGRIRMKICPEVYNFWSKKLGDTCWNDKGFISWLENRFGDLVKVKSRTDNVVV